MRQAGRYLPEYRATRAKAPSFLDFCYTPELAVEVTLQPIRRFGFDAAILFSDIMVVPHALGQHVWFEEGRGPRLDPVKSVGDLAALSLNALDDRLAPVYETVRGIRSELGPETALIGFAGAPWTVASYMVEGGGTREFAKVKSWAYGDPEGFQRLIDLLVDATTQYLKSQIAAGVEVLQLFDSWAGALTATGMRRWCLGPNAEIIRRIKATHPKIPIILFPRGVGLTYRDIAAESGADAVAVDSTVPPVWIRDELQSKVAVQGNLDPILLVSGGKALRDSATEIMDALAGGPFVFNLGSGIVPQASPDHVAELIDLVRSWPAQ
jgi:uroporphyrinogen decarboxylase